MFVWQSVVPVVLCLLAATAAVDVATAYSAHVDKQSNAVDNNSTFSSRKGARSVLASAAVERSPVVSPEEARASDSSNLPPLIPLSLLLGLGRFRNPQVWQPTVDATAGQARQAAS